MTEDEHIIVNAAASVYWSAVNTIVEKLSDALPGQCREHFADKVMETRFFADTSDGETNVSEFLESLGLDPEDWSQESVQATLQKKVLGL